MLRKEYLHGFILNYEDTNTREGFYYLKNELKLPESRVFFDQAKLKGQAEFEDRHNRQFTLLYDRLKNAYTLIRRAGN